MIMKGKEAVLVVGAGAGIGRAVVNRLLEEGEAVIAADLDTAYWEARENELEGWIRCDVLSASSVQDLVVFLLERRTSLKGLAFTVGKAMTLPVQSMKPQAYEQLFELNVESFLVLLEQVRKAGLFSPGQASVVVISSLVGELGARGKTAYSASKGALNSAVRSLAQETADQGLRVNAISPGTILTGMLDNLIATIGSDEVDKLASEFPLGFGYATDVADLAYYLLDPASRWITGTVISIDGGYSAK